MFKIKIKFDVLKIMAVAVILVFSISVFLQLINPLITKSYSEYKNMWMFFIYFTHQTGLISLIYAILILVNRTRRINTYLGIINTGNFLIVNIIAWVVLKSYTGWGESFNISMFTDILDHFVLFIFTTILWLITLTNKYFNRYNVQINTPKLLFFSSLFPTCFLFLAILFNFVKIDNNYFSVYGILTNFNPENGGTYLTFLIIPFIYLLFFLTTILYNFLFKQHFYEVNYNTIITFKQYNKLNILLYFYSIFLFVDFLLFIGTINNNTNIFYKSFMIICLIVCFIGIIYCVVIFINFLKLGIYTFLNIIFTLIIVNSFLEMIGKIMAVLYLLGFIEKLFNTLSVGNIAIVCSSYSGLNIVLAIWSFIYLHFYHSEELLMKEKTSYCENEGRDFSNFGNFDEARNLESLKTKTKK